MVLHWKISCALTKPLKCELMQRDVLRQLGLLTSPKAELHGFATEEINSYFASISICSNEEYSNSHNLINSASTNRFSFKPVTIQIAGKRRDGILQSIIAKALHHHHQTSALSFCYSFSWKYWKSWLMTSLITELMNTSGSQKHWTPSRRVSKNIKAPRLHMSTRVTSFRCQLGWLRTYSRIILDWLCKS